MNAEGSWGANVKLTETAINLVEANRDEVNFLEVVFDRKTMSQSISKTNAEEERSCTTGDTVI